MNPCRLTAALEKCPGTSIPLAFDCTSRLSPGLCQPSHNAHLRTTRNCFHPLRRTDNNVQSSLETHCESLARWPEARFLGASAVVQPWCSCAGAASLLPNHLHECFRTCWCELVPLPLPPPTLLLSVANPAQTQWSELLTLVIRAFGPFTSLRPASLLCCIQMAKLLNIKRASFGSFTCWVWCQVN